MSLCIDVQRLHSPTATLLQNLHLEVPAGVVHTLMGASGSGKSSLLAAVCGTLAPGMVFEGTLTLEGRRIDTLPTQARRVGILFQDDLLFAHMTVRENLLFAVPRAAQAQREAQALHMLDQVEMAHALHANPATLSGGQRTRVALARALLAQPQALLLDEPFARLDAPLRTRMRELVFGLVRQRQIPALLVTHDHADVTDSTHLTQIGAQTTPQH